MNKPGIGSEVDIDKLWSADLDGRQERTHYNDIHPVIREYLNTHHSEGSLLDLGCGYGQLSNIFDKIGFTVTAIDGDLDRIEEAKLTYPGIDFEHHKIESRLPFEDDSFDVLFSRSVFQYLDHDLILKECKRVLKKDGSIILLENLKNNPVTRIGRAYLKLTKYTYQSFPWNHFTLPEISKVSTTFENSSLHYYHLLSPLSYSKIFKKYYPLLFRIDQRLLRVKVLRNFAWLVLLTAKNK